MLTFGQDSNRTEDTHDSLIDQGHQNTCAVRSQEIIMRDYGIQIPQNELRNYAQEHGWYDDGTPINAIGNLLNTCGISTHVDYENNVYDLINELQQGHRVIVAVDADELWAKQGSKEWDFYNKLDNPNHALIVAGIKVDTEKPENSTVILTDPGKGDAYIEYNMGHFAQAWQDSNFYMMSTDEPAPYQYNETTHQMEFSNFATDYTVAEFPFHNEFSDIYDMTAINAVDYDPYYSNGYLYNVVEGVSHEDFLEHWLDDDPNALDGLLHVDDMDNSWNQIIFEDHDANPDSINDDNENSFFNFFKEDYSSDSY